ncbi:MAG: peptidoglycan-associated lipoprotein Pal [Alphaproteobacteria bacterium]|nr:peptidoglycan-associated lipoprotein Pal [Alphaproteobacteria bacterium]
MNLVKPGLKWASAVLLAGFVAACAGGDDKPTTTADQDVDQTQDRADVSQTDLDAPSYEPGTQEALEALAGSRIYFGYDRYDLSGQARDTLEAQAQWLKENPGLDVVIEGHCDERGTREYNLALGARRAAAAKNYLVALGINSDRIRTISYGKERPIALGSNPTAWAKNRRAVTIVE